MLDKSGYLSEATIAVFSTPLGGAISVFRMSGPEALQIAQRLFKEKNLKFLTRKIFFSKVYDGTGTIFDEALWTYFKAPKSYTGEDLVEIFFHGSPYIATKALETVIEYGARQALPGEFSFRAVRNGKLTLTQAEAVSDLITAQNDSAISLALEKMSGSESAIFQSISKDLKEIAARGELSIDFSDQDVEELSLENLKKKLRLVHSNLLQLGRSYQKGKRVQEGIPVAIVGLPNAGKSSFFNALLGEDRAIVSDSPGTTRDVVHEKITLRGHGGNTATFRIEDTAGLRKSLDVVEKIGIEKSLAAAQRADLLVLVIDGTVPFFETQEKWKEEGLFRLDFKNRAIGIITKGDLLEKRQRTVVQNKLQEVFGVERWHVISSKTTENISAVMDELVAASQKWVSRKSGEVLLTKENHKHAVEECLKSLERALVADEQDLFAADIRQGLAALSPIIGDTVPEDILGQIFSQFCIGK